MNRSKAIGTKAETAVVNAARPRGFPLADRHVLKGSLDECDVWLCPGVVVQVKGGAYAKDASENLIESWLNELEVQKKNARADVAFLVVQRRGISERNAHLWPAYIKHDDMLNLCGADGMRYGINRKVCVSYDDMLVICRLAGWGIPWGDLEGDE